MIFALESGWAVAGGLIPIIGLGGLGWILWRAVKDPPEEKQPEQPGADPRGPEEN